MEPAVLFAHLRVIVTGHVTIVAKRHPRFLVQHELAPAPPVMDFCSRVAATDTVFGDELTASVFKHESFSLLSIFKVEGMAF